MGTGLDSESLASDKWIESSVYTWKINTRDISDPEKEKNSVLVFSLSLKGICGGLNEKVPHGLCHLNTWFPGGGTVWGR